MSLNITTCWTNPCTFLSHQATSTATDHLIEVNPWKRDGSKYRNTEMQKYRNTEIQKKDGMKYQMTKRGH